MKKVTCLFILIIILCSCSSDKKQDINYIKPVELNDDEKDLLNLIGVANDIDILEYKTDNSFKSISVYLETYENGQLMTKPQEMQLQITSNKGKIGIVINKDDNFNWRISCQNGNGLASGEFKTDKDFNKNDQYSNSTSSLSDPVEIISDKEIVLKMYIFEDGNKLSVYDSQYYIEHPEALKEYDYVYLLKCRLSEKEIGYKKK